MKEGYLQTKLVEVEERIGKWEQELHMMDMGMNKIKRNINNFDGLFEDLTSYQNDREQVIRDVKCDMKDLAAKVCDEQVNELLVGSFNKLTDSAYNTISKFKIKIIDAINENNETMHERLKEREIEINDLSDDEFLNDAILKALIVEFLMSFGEIKGMAFIKYIKDILKKKKRNFIDTKRVNQKIKEIENLIIIAQETKAIMKTEGLLMEIRK